MRATSILALAALLLGSRPISAQRLARNGDEVRETTRVVCGISVPFKPDDQHPIVRVVSVHFEDVIEIPADTLRRLAAKIKENALTGEGWLVEPCERLRDAYQQRGYFKAAPTIKFEQVGGDKEHPEMALTLSAGSPGARYRLETITFKNQHAFTAAELRPLFPIKDGEVFNINRIRRGLEQLRYAYGRRGYIDSTCVPDTAIDERDKLVSLIIDLDEGEKSRLNDDGERYLIVDDVLLRGAQPWLVEEMRRWWVSRIGKAYRSSDAKRFFETFSRRLPYKTAPFWLAVDVSRRYKDRAVLSFNFGPDPTLYAQNPAIPARGGSPKK